MACRVRAVSANEHSNKRLPLATTSTWLTAGARKVVCVVSKADIDLYTSAQKRSALEKGAGTDKHGHPLSLVTVSTL